MNEISLLTTKFSYLQTNGKRTSEILLENALTGAADYAGFLRLLSENPNEMQQLFLQDLQAYFLLLAYRVDKEHSASDKELLLRFYPFYVSKLEETEKNKKTVFSSAGHSRREAARAFLFGEGNLVNANKEIENAGAIFGQLVGPQSALTVSQSLCCWYNADYRTSLQFDFILNKLANCTQAGRGDVFDQFLQSVPNCQSGLIFKYKGVSYFLAEPRKEYVNFLAELLFCEGEDTFNIVSASDRHGAILLILLYWEKSKDESVLDLLLYAMPYCLDTLDTACPHGSIQEAVTQFLKDPTVSQNGNDKFLAYLSELPVTYDHEELIQAITCWHRSAQPCAAAVFQTLSLYAECFGTTFLQGLTPAISTKETFSRYFAQLNSLKEGAQTIPHLGWLIPLVRQSKFKEEITDQFFHYEQLMEHLEVQCKKNPTDPLATFFALAVRSELYSQDKTAAVVARLISDDAPPACAAVASIMLFKEIPDDLIPKVFARVCEHNDVLLAFIEFYTQGLFSKEMRDIFIDQLMHIATMPSLTAAYCLKDPLYLTKFMDIVGCITISLNENRIATADAMLCFKIVSGFTWINDLENPEYARNSYRQLANRLGCTEYPEIQIANKKKLKRSPGGSLPTL